MLGDVMGHVLAVLVALAALAGAQGAPTLADAQAKLQAQDLAGAAKLLEEITAREPKNARALRMLGVARHQLKEYERAADAYSASLALEPDQPVVLYNRACLYALEGNPDRAFETLGKAKATRKIDMAQIEVDPELASLASDPRFAALLPKPADFADSFVEPATVVRQWIGEATNDQFGWIARNIGDVDGDGVPDVVTSAPTKDVGGANAGRVYVFSTMTGKKLWTADGDPGDQLGLGVEGAGDTNRDGIPDVVAGAPGGGHAKVYSGRDGSVLHTLKADAVSDGFGRHVSTAGDLDRDGCADVFIGAPGHNAGGSGAGRAYVFSGRDGRALLTLTGERAGDQFGATVAGADSGDGVLLVVGAPGAGPTRRGRAYVYDSLSEMTHFTVDADETGAALAAMFVSVPGDVDADGADDVYLSDWSNAAKGPSTGRVYVHSGKDGRRLLTLTGEGPGEGFGTSPSVAGDVDRDGHADLIVGAWQYGGGAVSGGRATLYSGKDGRQMKTFTCRMPGDAFGFDAVTMGDVDGDRTDDFLVTAAWSGIAGYHSGRVLILSSGVKR